MRTDRRVGMEQEFFLVDRAGYVSDRGDEFLERCREEAGACGVDPDHFSEECTFGMVEIKTDPHRELRALRDDYMSNVGVALQAGRTLGLRLYPLATYPLRLEPSFRPNPRYGVQIQTIGPEVFAGAGRCIGVHMHLEAPEGVVDAEEIVAQNAPVEGVSRLLDLYNLATALDPAIIALTRACPFYESTSPGLATRTAFYRGSRDFGWAGVYADLPELGGLNSYVGSAAEIIERQLAGKEAWVAAMERAGVEAAKLSEMSASVLDLCWRPVRIGGGGTVEIRSIDGNYPRIVFAIAALIQAAADRVTRENLKVEPTPSLRSFESDERHLFVPGFDFIAGELLYESVTVGVGSPVVREYLDALLDFAGADIEFVRDIWRSGTPYETTEAEVLARFSSKSDELDEEDGLRLVVEACDRLEDEVLAAPGITPPGVGTRLTEG